MKKYITAALGNFVGISIPLLLWSMPILAATELPRKVCSKERRPSSSMRAADGLAGLFEADVTADGCIEAKLTSNCGCILTLSSSTPFSLAVERAIFDEMEMSGQITRTKRGTLLIKRAAAEELLGSVINRGDIVPARSIAIINGVIKLQSAR